MIAIIKGQPGLRQQRGVQGHAAHPGVGRAAVGDARIGQAYLQVAALQQHGHVDELLPRFRLLKAHGFHDIGTHEHQKEVLGIGQGVQTAVIAIRLFRPLAEPRERFLQAGESRQIHQRAAHGQVNRIGARHLQHAVRPLARQHGLYQGGVDQFHLHGDSRLAHKIVLNQRVEHTRLIPAPSDP